MIDDLIQRLCYHGQDQPDQPAVVEVGRMGRERVLTWSQLRSAAHAFSQKIQGALDAADTLLVSSECGLEQMVCILGALWAGKTVLPVARDVPRGELMRLAHRAAVALAVGGPKICAALRSDARECWPIDSVELGATSAAPSGFSGGSGSILLQSSGTTGMPKIVRRSERALAAVGRNCCGAIGLDREDVILVCTPLSHSYGIDMAVAAATWAGCRTVMHPRFDPSAVRSSLANRGVSVLPGVPLTLNVLSRPTAGEPKAPVLRRAFSAGSPLPLRVYEQFLGAYGVPMGQIYGTTELGAVLYNDPYAYGFAPGRAGRPMQGVTVRILDIEDARVDSPLDLGNEGHVAISTPSMFTEYVDAPAPAKESEFLPTGDLGFLDREGFLTLTGRVNLLVDVGGLKVNPLEVEAVLEMHPGVREAVVVPMEYSDTASRLKAFLIAETKPAPSLEEIRRFARENLIYYKLPRSYEFRGAFPRSPSGKILRHELRGVGSREGA